MTICKLLFATFAFIFQAANARAESPNANFYLEVDTGYQGPVGRVSHDAPKGDEKYESYRYGLNQEFAATSSEMNQLLGKAQAQRQEEAERSASNRELQAQLQRERENDSPRSPSPPTPINRRLQNPVPAGSSEQRLAKHADAVWEDVRAKNPIAMQKHMSELLARLEFEKEENRNFVLKDLAFSKVINPEGVLILPFAPAPSLTFDSNNFSPLGQSLRFQVNRAQVSQSLIGAACAKPNSPIDACELWRDRLSDTIEGLYMFDHLVAMDGGIVSALNQVLFDQLKATIDFSEGAVSGVIAGGMAMYDGAVQFLRSPRATIVALASAIWNIRQVIPAIADGGAKLIEEFRSKGALRRGEILGRAAFEIGAVLIPISKVPGAMAAGKLASAAAFETLARVVEASGELNRIISPFQTRALFAAKALRLEAEHTERFLEWSAKYLDQSDNALLLITFAKRMTTERWQAILGIQEKLGTLVSEAAHEYLVKQVTYEATIFKEMQKSAFTIEDMERIALRADHIDKAIGGMKGIPAPSEGIRVTRSTWIEYKHKFNEIRLNSAETMFIPNEGGQFRSFRFSMPGQNAVYTVEGTGELAIEASLEEIKAAKGQIGILTAEETLHPQNILVVDKAMLRHLGFESAEEAFSSYEATQMIGYFAERHGFDAIRAPGKGAQTNLILLK